MTQDTSKLTLDGAVAALEPENDRHWNLAGKPDMNHLKETTGTNVTRADMEAAGHGKLTRAKARKAAKEAAAMYDGEDDGKGLPKADAAVDAAQAAPLPDNHPISVGARIIASLDRLAVAMSPEVARYQPELQQVLQGFTAERPSIIERQKRLEARENRS